jgi:predicted nucleic acid-binding protein
LKIVVDTSAIIAVIANEPERGAIIEATKGAFLIAPSSVYWEVGNAFSAMLRRGRVGFRVIEVALEIFRTIPIRFVDVELEKSLKIAKDTNSYCYDAYLLRCAQKYGAPLITLDKKLVRIAKALSVAIIEIEVK